MNMWATNQVLEYINLDSIMRETHFDRLFSSRLYFSYKKKKEHSATWSTSNNMHNNLQNIFD